MQTIESPELSTPERTEKDLEVAEVDWLLTSGVLGRAVSLIRVLKYICAEHFEGRTDQIRECTIAVEALGRRPDFDPQTDTIVRVTVHALRKRLLEIYQREGATRPLHLVIPPGRYAPCFIHREPHRPTSPPPIAGVAEPERPEPVAASGSSPDGPADPPQGRPPTPPERRNLGIAIGLLAAVAVAMAWFAHSAWVKKVRPGASAVPAPAALIRALMGGEGRTYVDHSGNTWTSANYCQGGANVAVPAERIEGTEDAALYLSGVRGIAHCVFPVKPGFHEIHFYFAETSDLPAATRVATLSINAGPGMDVDVVDEAGGNRIATSTVVTGVAPENDGAIHVDLTSEVSLLNAVEILPATSAKLLPVRIVASSQPIVDAANQLWMSDRYFSGGRHGLAPDSTARKDLGILASDRVGRFRYNIPAVPLARYRVKLYFREPWFGDNNGGPGSRVFDVACNGVLWLKNFDILAEGGAEPVTKTFEDVQASASGRIEISFMPVVNYPVVNAIEVAPD